jgi:alpha-ribazole phosphatase
MQLPLAIDDHWQEMNFGAWDGKSYESLHNHHPEALSAFWSSPWNHSAPEGETLPDFYQRIRSAWYNLLKTHQG